MLGSWVRVKSEGTGRIHAICDDLPGKSFLVNLKNGKSDWFQAWDVEFLNGPSKEVKDQGKEEIADQDKKGTKRRRKTSSQS